MYPTLAGKIKGLSPGRITKRASWNRELCSHNGPQCRPTPARLRSMINDMAGDFRLPMTGASNTAV
eukprot:10288685-Lingulodinium_polyedra.AAC.1